MPIVKSRLLPGLCIAPLFILVFIPVFPDLFDAWMNNSDDSHGALVPLISAYLIWQRREKLSKTPTGVCAWGGWLLAVSLLIYLIGYAGAVAVATRLMLVAALVGLVLFNLGKAVFSLIAFPLCFLVFMVPVPVSIYSLAAFPLQLFASQISALVISALQIPVLREGNMLYFAQTQLEVAEACSGLRSLTSFIMLAFLFSYIMRPGWRKRVLMVTAAIPLALFANIVRVTGTGILAHFIGGKAAQGFLHEFSGLAVFAFGFVFLLLLYKVLEGRPALEGGSVTEAPQQDE
jgi:exosortase